MPDSRPRPPLLAWDGIVIANADFAAMVAAAVNATSAERREADSLSAAATVAAPSRASRAHRRSLFDAHARNGQYQSIARARQSPHTRHPSSHPSSSTFHRASFVPIHPSTDPSIHLSIDRRPPSARASRVRSSRAHSRAYRAKGSGVRGRREHRGRRRRRVSRARARTPVTTHPPARPDRVSLVTLEVSFHDSRLVDAPLTHATRDCSIEIARRRPCEGRERGMRGFRCTVVSVVSSMDDVRTSVRMCRTRG